MPEAENSILRGKPSPYSLYGQAHREWPNDHTAATARYIELMKEHGHLIPKATVVEFTEDGQRVFQARCEFCGWHSYPVQFRKQAKQWGDKHGCTSEPPEHDYGGMA